jgi:hypothetical protein
MAVPEACSWGKAKIWDSVLAVRVGPSQRLANCTRDIGFVNDVDAGRRLKVELRLWNRNILLPIAEAEFGFDISRLTEHYANEAGLRVRLEKNFTERAASVGGIV